MMTATRSAIGPHGLEARSLPRSAVVREFGETVLIGTYVASQFVDIPLGHPLGISLSVQKVAAGLAFPYALLLIGSVRTSRRLVLFGGALILAFTVGNLVSPYGSTAKALGSIAFVAVGLLGACALFTVLVTGRDAFVRFVRVWIAIAVFSALVCVLQAAGVVPLFNVPSTMLGNRAALGGFYRATGFKYDPNFQAFMLLVGFSFARFYPSRFKRLVVPVIAAGILATFSRSAFAIAVLIFVLGPLIEGGRKALPGAALAGRVVLAAFVAASVSAVALALAPTAIHSYVKDRIHDATRGITTMTNEVGAGPSDGSASERVRLNRGALHLIATHPVSGIGAFNGPQALYAATGVKKAAHDTLLETLMVGGIFGALALAGYAFSALSAFRIPNVGPDWERAATRGVVFVFSAMCFFLTFDYNAILWLPLTLAAAHHALEGSRERHGVSTAVVRSP